MSSHNPLNITTVEGDEYKHRSTVISMEESLALQEAAEVYDAFDRSRLKSRATNSKFSHLDVSLAKSMRDVEESTPQVLWAAYDKYADAGQWCKLDQIRLISLDFMFRRYLAFHRNHLSFKVSNTRGYIEWLPSVTHGEEVLAFSTQTFGKGRTYEPAKDTMFANLQQDLQAIVNDKVEFRWIHIADLRCLEKVAEAFGLHKFAKLFFMDLRCHSSISAFQDGIFASIMTVRIVCTQAHMYKIYYFSTENFLLTFEREVIQDSSNKRMKDHVSVPYRDMAFSVLNNREMHDESDDMLAQAVREEMKTNDNKLLDALNVADLPHGVVSIVMSKCKGEVYESVCNGGSMFLLYEIMMQSLLASESVLEFMARSIDYFKSQIYKRLTNNAKKNFFRENATLKSSVRLMMTMVDDVLYNLKAMMDKTTIEFDFVSKRMMSSWEATLCVAEMEDSFRFRKSCLQSQLAECSVLAVSLEHQMDLISERESKNLNLVATIFLPLTFWAGVFGMNFEVDGEFTMDILNKEEGPNIFWAICVACVVINLVLFARSGMIDFDYFFKRELRSSPDDEAFESSVSKLKKNMEKRETFRTTLSPQSEFVGDRKTFDISVN